MKTKVTRRRTYSLGKSDGGSGDENSYKVTDRCAIRIHHCVCVLSTSVSPKIGFRSVGSINDIRRNIQDVIGTKANINIGPAVENYGGETFLSEEVAISLLQETKQAFKRCQMVRKCLIFSLSCKLPYLR